MQSEEFLPWRQHVLKKDLRSARVFLPAQKSFQVLDTRARDEEDFLSLNLTFY